MVACEVHGEFAVFVPPDGLGWFGQDQHIANACHKGLRWVCGAEITLVDVLLHAVDAGNAVQGALEERDGLVEALRFDVEIPPLPSGRYRLYGDIVHESGYAQTLVNVIDLPGGDQTAWSPTDPDDSAFDGRAVGESPSSSFELTDGATRVTRLQR